MMRLFLLAAAATAIAAAPVWAQAVPPSCPSEPMQVVRSRGGVIDYFGTVPNVPDLCRMQRSDGGGNFYYGSWRMDWPGAGQAYPVLKNVILGGKGTRLAFVTRSVPGMQWVDTFVNAGTEPMIVGGVTYTTLRLEHDRKGIEGNTYHSNITTWRDMKTGVVLRTLEDQIAGQSYGPDTTWQAIRVIRTIPPS